MELSTALTHDLATLVAISPVISGSPPPDGQDALSETLSSLHDGAALAVTSMLGLTVTMTVQGQDVTLTSMSQHASHLDVGASLQVPLTAISVEAEGNVTLYAGTPGAFVDLAADLTYELGIDADRLVLDQHLTPGPVSGITGARELSLMNTAIGILIERGQSPAQAEQELQRLASAAGIHPALVARRILDEAADRT